MSAIGPWPPTSSSFSTLVLLVLIAENNFYDRAVSQMCVEMTSGFSVPPSFSSFFQTVSPRFVLMTRSVKSRHQSPPFPFISWRRLPSLYNRQTTGRTVMTNVFFFFSLLCDSQASFYSTALKTLISVSTVILLGLIVAYHALEVQVCADSFHYIATESFICFVPASAFTCHPMHARNLDCRDLR